MLKKLLLNVTIEFGPLIGFFIISEFTSFIRATMVLVVLMALSLVLSYIERGKAAPFPLMASVTIITFGLFTIILKDPFYLILKDTLYNGIFAVILFVGLYFNKALLEPMFKDLFCMTERGWRTLSFRWAVMFTLLTISNELVRINCTPEEWVMYKGVATLATIIFSLYQFKLAKKERLPESTPWGMRIPVKN